MAFNGRWSGFRRELNTEFRSLLEARNAFQSFMNFAPFRPPLQGSR